MFAAGFDKTSEFYLSLGVLARAGAHYGAPVSRLGFPVSQTGRMPHVNGERNMT